MANSRVSWVVQDGNGDFAKGMEYATYLLKVKNYLLIERQVQLLSHPSAIVLRNASSH